MTTKLEEHFAHLEAQLADVERDATALKKAAGSARRAAQEGAPGDLTRSIEQARLRAQALLEKLSAVEDGKVDYTAYLEGPGYIEELKAAAQAAGLSLVERDGRLTAFPLIVRLEPRTLAVRINRKPVRHLRPSFLTRQLQAMQSRRSGFRPAEFLRSLFGAYQRLSHQFGPAFGPQSEGPGPVIPLIAVHETLTLMPGAAREYPIDEFGRDLLLLDREPDLATPTGHGFRMPASTGSRSTKRIVVYDETGAEHVYVGLQFMGR